MRAIRHNFTIFENLSLIVEIDVCLMARGTDMTQSTRRTVAKMENLTEINS